MRHDLINPAAPPERQREKLIRIVEVLMARVEEVTDDSGLAYRQFLRAVLLEDQVRARTREGENTLALLNATNARLTTARAEAEAARANLANAIETVKEGFALFGPDDRLILCNSRFGMHMPDVRPGLQPGLAFQDYVVAVSKSSHLKRRASEPPEVWAEDRMRRHLDSHVMLTVALTRDRWMQVSEHRTADGGTVIIQTDITDIIRSEREVSGKLLDDQARIIRATLDHINQGVAIFNSGSRLIGWNNRLAELLAISIGSLRIGLGVQALGGHRDAKGSGILPPALVAWVKTGAPRGRLGLDMITSRGTVLSVHGQEMENGGFVVSFTDITAERQAMRVISDMNQILETRVRDRTQELADALERAEQASNSRARFVAAASHDLLQPLSAAKLFMSTLSDGDLSPVARDTLAKARNALGSVEGILSALLDISRLETGRVALDVGPIDLGRMLAQLGEEFAPMAVARGLKLRVRPTRILVQSDFSYLRRILQNLIGNALRYTDKGGVLVGVRHLGQAVRIDVVDSGVGIAAGEREVIFEEFHRLNARASASEGMGLGLAIVKRAAELLGHGLDLSSQPGKGSRFSLIVPVVM
jgi:signal transduction histidine kinase